MNVAPIDTRELADTAGLIGISPKTLSTWLERGILQRDRSGRFDPVAVAHVRDVVGKIRRYFGTEGFGFAAVVGQLNVPELVTDPVFRGDGSLAAQAGPAGAV